MKKLYQVKTVQGKIVEEGALLEDIAKKLGSSTGFRIPSWLDMCTLKEVFWEDEEEAYQIHPKRSQYVNCAENCLHLWKPVGHEIDELVYGIVVADNGK